MTRLSVLEAVIARHPLGSARVGEKWMSCVVVRGVAYHHDGKGFYTPMIPAPDEVLVDDQKRAILYALASRDCRGPWCLNPSRQWRNQ